MKGDPEIHDLEKRHEWAMAVRHRASHLHRALGRACELLESDDLSESDLRILQRRVSAAYSEFTTNRQPRMSQDLSRLLYANEYGAQVAYGVIEVDDKPTRRPAPRDTVSGPITNLHRYEYLEGGRKRTVPADSACHAVLKILSERTGVADLTRDQVSWDLNGDTIAIGRYRRKRVTATLTF